MGLMLRPVTQRNVQDILELAILPSQRSFIESIPQCLADAADDPRYQPVGIYQENQLIGFAMYGKFDGKEEAPPEIWLDRFLIDYHQQGQGLGTQALSLLLTNLRQEYQCQRIFLSVYPDNQAALHLYEEFGFRPTGTFDIHGESIYAVDLE